MKKIASVIARALLAVVFANVYVYGITPLEEIGSGARVKSLGSAYVGLADDVSSIFTNSAGLSELKGAQVSFSQTKLMDAVNYLQLSCAMPTSKLGSFGLGYVRSDVGDIYQTKVDSLGNISYDTSKDSMEDVESMLLLSYATREFYKVAIGGSFKYLSQKISNVENGSADGIQLDLGVKYNLNDQLKLGFTKHNMLTSGMGGGFAWDTGEKENVDSASIAGCAYRPTKGLNLALDYQFKSNTSGEPSLVRCGAEYSPIDHIVLRAGLNQRANAEGAGSVGRDNNITAGIGFNIFNIKLDYSYHQYGDISDDAAYYVSLGYEFKNKQNQQQVKKASRVITKKAAVVPSEGVKSATSKNVVIKKKKYTIKK